jgi:periplasmic protein TonB
MFETVVPETFEVRSKRLLYETLPVSIALHVLALGGFALTALWTIAFPVDSPRIVRAYSLVAIPDPPPPPPPPRAQQPALKRAELPPPEPEKIVAPTVIPDTIPQLSDPAPDVAALAPATAVEPARDPGIPGGAIDGKINGEVGGKLHGVASQFFPQDGRVHIERNQSLPLKVVEQEYPAYPDKAKKLQLEDQVVVRYIIGKKGQVIDVQIIDHAKEPMFDEATVDAIRRWRFRPMIQDGKPVEVVHELAVNFELIRH